MKANFKSIAVPSLACAGLLFTPAVLAHTFGAHGAGFAEGFAHPFMGLDHLLAMVAVGLWASQLGGRSAWLVPVAFIAVMAGAAWLGSALQEWPLLEPAIAASVLLLGLLVAFAVRVNTFLSMILAGLFACFHGLAHGLELPQTASPVLYFAGFLAATAMLQGFGLGLGASLRQASSVARMGGTLIALTGLYLLAS